MAVGRITQKTPDPEPASGVHPKRRRTSPARPAQAPRRSSSSPVDEAGVRDVGLAEYR